MQLVKDKEIVNDTWRYVPDDGDFGDGDITVSLARWKSDQQSLLNHKGKVGLRLLPSDGVDSIVDDLDNIQLIELEFPDFADGRLFSHAWLLRSRYGYLNEIRAIGHYIPDQVFYLSRVGVNAFLPAKSSDLPFVLANLNDFTVKYQNSVN